VDKVSRKTLGTLKGFLRAFFMITLKDISKTKKERPWRAHKQLTGELIKVYTELSTDPDKKDYYQKKVYSLSGCGNNLTFVQCPAGHQEAQRLKLAYFCKQRLCPMCQWRRSLFTFHDFLSVAHRAQENNPGIQFVLITLTAKNVTGNDLQKEITHYMDSYKRLCRYKSFKKSIIGTYRTFEITANEERNDFHPHFHIIGAVKKSYFKTDNLNYITHDQLMSMWRKAFQIDYDPNVDIRKVKKRQKNIQTVFEEIKEEIKHLSAEKMSEAIIQELAKNDIAQAGAEVAKYSVKVSDILKQKNRNEVVEVLDSVLYNRRFISYGGILDDARKQLKIENKIQDIENSDLINISNEKELCQCPICQSELIHAQYIWNNENSDYFSLK